jgi:hypothetical protein
MPYRNNFACAAEEIDFRPVRQGFLDGRICSQKSWMENPLWKFSRAAQIAADGEAALLRGENRQ